MTWQYLMQQVIVGSLLIFFLIEFVKSVLELFVSVRRESMMINKSLLDWKPASLDWYPGRVPGYIGICKKCFEPISVELGCGCKDSKPDQGD